MRGPLLRFLWDLSVFSPGTLHSPTQLCVFNFSPRYTTIISYTKAFHTEQAQGLLRNYYNVFRNKMSKSNINMPGSSFGFADGNSNLPPPPTMHPSTYEPDSSFLHMGSPNPMPSLTRPQLRTPSPTNPVVHHHTESYTHFNVFPFVAVVVLALVVLATLISQINRKRPVIRRNASSLQVPYGHGGHAVMAHAYVVDTTTVTAVGAPAAIACSSAGETCPSAGADCSDF